MDGLTSEESGRAVEEHVQECAECRDFLHAMKADLESEKYLKIDEVQAETEIQALKKLKKVITNRTVFGVIVAVLFVINILWGFYEDTGGVVRIGFVSKKDNVRLEGWMGTSHEESSEEVLTNASGSVRESLSLVVSRISPVRKGYDMDRNFCLDYVFLDDGTVIYLNEYGENERVNENDILTVEFEDKTVEIPIKELRTEAGIEKLR